MNRQRMQEGCGQEYLTGGTRDVNPQIWRAQMDVGTGLAQQSFPSGTMVNPDGTAYVMEALRVKWEFNGTLDLPAAVQQSIFTASLATEQPVGGTGTWGSNAFLFSKFNFDIYNLGLGTENVIAQIQNIYEDDLTDNAGHGILLASNEIWMSSFFDSVDAPIDISVAIFYRWKKISMADFTGLWKNWNR